MTPKFFINSLMVIDALLIIRISPANKAIITRL